MPAPKKYLTAEDECSSKKKTMDYVHCRAKKMKSDGYTDDKAYPTAWSIACGAKRQKGDLEDAEEHCQRKPSEYFTGKKALESEMSVPTKYMASVEAEQDLEARFEKGVPADPTENMSEEDKKEWERQKELNKDVVKNQHKKAYPKMEQSSLDGLEKEGVPPTEDFFIYYYGKEIASWNVDEMVEDDFAKRAAMEANNLFYSNPKKLLQKLGVRSRRANLTQEYFSQPLMAKEMENIMSNNNHLASEYEAGHTPETFKKMLEDNPELEEKWKEMTEKHKDVVKNQHKDKKANGKTAKLMKRQIKILEQFASNFVNNPEYMPTFFNGLPSTMRDQLRRVKDQETLQMDAERWLGDWQMQQRMSRRFANSPYLTRSAKENPMNKEAKMATLRNLTASWGLTAHEATEMLAEEELEAYLAEMFAEQMMAEEEIATKDENAANSGFKKYEAPIKQTYAPNTFNKRDRGGQGAGGKGNRNHLYYDYGSAPKGKAYQKWYTEQGLRNPANRPGKQTDRSVCPDMKGGKGTCSDK